MSAAAPNIATAAQTVLASVTDAVFLAVPLAAAQQFAVLTQGSNNIPFFVLVTGAARLDQMAVGGGLNAALLAQVIGSQVVPFLNDTSVPLVANFNADVAAYSSVLTAAAVSDSTLEGMCCVCMCVHVLVRSPYSFEHWLCLMSVSMCVKSYGGLTNARVHRLPGGSVRDGGAATRDRGVARRPHGGAVQYRCVCCGRAVRGAVRRRLPRAGAGLPLQPGPASRLAAAVHHRRAAGLCGRRRAVVRVDQLRGHQQQLHLRAADAGHDGRVRHRHQRADVWGGDPSGHRARVRPGQRQRAARPQGVAGDV